MAISSILPTVIIILLSLLVSHATSVSEDPTLSDLLSLQSQSRTGVIHLTDELLRRILLIPTPRPFHFMVFFDAKNLHSESELNLLKYKSEFSLVSSSFITNNPNQTTSLFFFVIEFEESRSSFSEFGIKGLPNIRLIPPSVVDLKTDSIPIRPGDAGDYSGLAEAIAGFVESRAKISVGSIVRPPFMSTPQIILIVGVVLISIPYLIRRLIAGNTILHNKNLWMAGAIFIYFFSVSGAMFNIIRKMPMFMMDREDPSKLVFFYKGSGMQLGTEGFAVGSLYTIVGLLLGCMTHVFVRVKNLNMQRLLMIIALFVSFWAVKKVVSLDHWKTGYGPRIYLPSSWFE